VGGAVNPDRRHQATVSLLAMSIVTTLSALFTCGTHRFRAEAGMATVVPVGDATAARTMDTVGALPTLAKVPV
jgi:hypothetical protein